MFYFVFSTTFSDKNKVKKLDAVYSPIPETDIKYLVSLNCYTYCMCFLFLSLEFKYLVNHYRCGQWLNVSNGYLHAAYCQITRPKHFVNKARIHIIIELTLFHGDNGEHILQGHGLPQIESRGLCYSLEVEPTSYREAEKERNKKILFFKVTLNREFQTAMFINLRLYLIS